MRRVTLILFLALAAAAPARCAPAGGVGTEPSPGLPPDPHPPQPTSPAAALVAPTTATLCQTIGAAAARNDLPVGFFTRLIWQESRFDPTARSPAGAQGVAQFMPATASWRGLADPFAPALALDGSASYLKDLRAQFGNLGLAAAAYNAGPGRVARWLAGTASLPDETLAYVQIVTGHPAAAWRETTPPSLAPEPQFSCLGFAGEAGHHLVPALPPGTPNGAGGSEPPPKPWSVILVGSLNRGALMSEYNTVRATYSKILGPLTPAVRRRRIGGEPTLRYVVQIEEDDRAASDSLCHRLERAGGACIVLRNSGR